MSDTVNAFAGLNAVDNHLVMVLWGEVAVLRAGEFKGFADSNKIRVKMVQFFECFYRDMVVLGNVDEGVMSMNGMRSICRACGDVGLP